MIMELTQTDLPLPVEPAISRWGILQRSATCAVPAMSFAEGHRQRAAHVDIILGFKDCADVDGGADLVRNLDADGGLAGDGRFNAHTRGGQVQGDVVGQACDAADLDTGLGLQLIPGDGRPRQMSSIVVLTPKLSSVLTRMSAFFFISRAAPASSSGRVALKRFSDG